MRIFFLLIALCCLLPCSAVSGNESYTLSMLPILPPEKLTALLMPLAARLSTETGNSIRPVLTKNTAEYEAGLLRGAIVIGYENPVSYVNASSQHEVLATAVRGKNGGQLHGLIISRSETGIAEPKDLQGKTIMISGKDSAGGYLSQKQTLQEAGLDLERDCRLLEAGQGREENVVIAVSLGDADAGFVSESVLHQAEEFIRPGSVITVMKTALLPNWAVSVRRDMPQAQKEELQAILIRLPKNDPVLKALGITAFKAAEDADYDIIRRLAE